MKAISMYQPWASLWLTDAKIHETRPREFHHRGWVLVHATKHIDLDCIDGEPGFAAILDSEFGHHWGLELPRGAIIGAVNIIGCHTSEYLVRKWSDEAGIKIAHWDDYQCGNYAPRRFGIERAPEVKKFATPIPYRGMQAVPFDVPDEIVREAMTA